MPKRSSKPPADPNRAAHDTVRRLTAGDDPEPTAEERSQIARILGSLGGKKGGRARAAALSPEERSRIARRAAQARWRQPEE